MNCVRLHQRIPTAEIAKSGSSTDRRLIPRFRFGLIPVCAVSSLAHERGRPEPDPAFPFGKRPLQVNPELLPEAARRAKNPSGFFHRSPKPGVPGYVREETGQGCLNREWTPMDANPILRTFALIRVHSRLAIVFLERKCREESERSHFESISSVRPRIASSKNPGSW